MMTLSTQRHSLWSCSSSSCLYSSCCCCCCYSCCSTGSDYTAQSTIIIIITRLSPSRRPRRRSLHHATWLTHSSPVSLTVVTSTCTVLPGCMAHSRPSTLRMNSMNRTMTLTMGRVQGTASRSRRCCSTRDPTPRRRLSAVNSCQRLTVTWSMTMTWRHQHVTMTSSPPDSATQCIGTAGSQATCHPHNPPSPSPWDLPPPPPDCSMYRTLVPIAAAVRKCHSVRWYISSQVDTIFSMLLLLKFGDHVLVVGCGNVTVMRLVWRHWASVVLHCQMCS